MRTLSALLLCLCLPAWAEWSGVCVKVLDGDTIVVHASDGADVKVRLKGIDAPEIAHKAGEAGQPFGEEARKALVAIALDKPVVCADTGKDLYGRVLTDVRAGDKWVNLELVAAGWAWAYDRYPVAAEVKAAELAAVKARLGLWSADDPEPPWIWRKERKIEQLAAEVKLEKAKYGGHGAGAK